MSHGLPVDRAAGADPAAREALAHARSLDGEPRRAALAGVAARSPATSTCGPRSVTRAAMTSSATPTTGSGTTAGSTPCAPTDGGDPASCAGPSRPTKGSCAHSPDSGRWRPPSARRTRRSASRTFLAQLDPSGSAGSAGRDRRAPCCAVGPAGGWAPTRRSSRSTAWRWPSGWRGRWPAAAAIPWCSSAATRVRWPGSAGPWWPTAGRVKDRRAGC